MIKEIKAYKLSDGRIVEEQDEACRLEIEMLLKKCLENFCREHLSANCYDCEGLADELFENRELLAEALDCSHWEAMVKGTDK